MDRAFNEGAPGAQFEGTQFALGRRGFLRGSLALAAGLAAGPLWPLRGSALSADTERLLRESGFTYISPLRSNGSESACHGEVWFGWLRGSVVISANSDTWKVRAIARGLDRARIWVGDHGRWRAGRNERFRSAPSFDARAVLSKDESLLDELMQLYTGKYPGAFSRWEKRMRDGFVSGARGLVRYTPL
ncbi:MAG: hypothetical protein OXU92_07015 [Deltaproteobacteria bacterium]|nr:hypothetical protein [Deltaproteobacteria bacterium]